MNSTLQFQSKASGAVCVAIELSRGDVADRDYDTLLGNRARYFDMRLHAARMDTGPWAVHAGKESFDVMLFPFSVESALPELIATAAELGFADTVKIGLLANDGTWTQLHPKPGEAFSLVEEISGLPPRYYELEDRLAANQAQIEKLEYAVRRHDALKWEVGNLRERLESLRFRLEFDMISTGEFDNHHGSIRERIEACAAELGVKL